MRSSGSSSSASSSTSTPFFASPPHSSTGSSNFCFHLSRDRIIILLLLLYISVNTILTGGNFPSSGVCPSTPTHVQICQCETASASPAPTCPPAPTVTCPPPVTCSPTVTCPPVLASTTAEQVVCPPVLPLAVPSCPPELHPTPTDPLLLQSSEDLLARDLQYPVPHARFAPLAQVGLGLRALVVYVYYETPIAKANLEFFLRHGLLPPRFADYVFLLQEGPNVSTVQFPQAVNIQVVRKPNRCFDLGSWGAYLNERNFDVLAATYKYFVFINASVRGPFLPAWAPVNWLTIFASQITDKVKLVGLTANCRGADCGWLGDSQYAHLQSMFLLTDALGLRSIWHLLQLCPESKFRAVLDVEMLMSRTIIASGYSWRGQMLGTAYEGYLQQCLHGDMMAQYHVPGERLPPPPPTPSPAPTTPDPSNPFLNSEPATTTTPAPPPTPQHAPRLNIHPLEVIFIKANRGIYPEQLQAYTVWADRALLGVDWRQQGYEVQPHRVKDQFACIGGKELDEANLNARL